MYVSFCPERQLFLKKLLITTSVDHFNLSGSGSQDIRNIIPFSGKGFLLGGKLQSSLSTPPPQPTAAVTTASSSSHISSPKNLSTPSPPAESLSSPFHSGLHNKGISSIVSSIRPPIKPPVKRSVSNTKAFVNINGSPVRIPKSKDNSSCQEAKKIKQRSIEDLLSFGTSGSRSRTSNTGSKKASQTAADSSVTAVSLHSDSRTSNTSSSMSGDCSSVVSTGTRGSPAELVRSKFFNHSSGGSSSQLAGGSQASRKRAWDVHNNSATIFSFFQKTLDSDSSLKSKLPAAQQRNSTATSSSSSSTTSSLQSSSTASSSFSTVPMVSCPVCQAKVEGSKINEHLDSCLS